MRGDQLSRQWKMIRMIEMTRKGRTVPEMAEELGVSPRTVYRDLDALQAAGFTLYTEPDGRHTFWKLLNRDTLPPAVHFDLNELMALHLGRDLLRVFDGTAFQQSIESLFEKVRKSLTPKTINYLDRMAGRLAVGFRPTRDYSDFKKIISDLSASAADKKRVEIKYKAASTGKVTTRKVEPYQVWAMNGAFYLIGLCHLRNAVRTFAVDRILEFTPLDESFRMPDDFSLDDYMQSAFQVMTGDPVKVSVKFTPAAAHVVRERIWHPTQELREEADGSLVATMEVPINYEVVSWILGFGPAAEVLAPKELVDRIHNEHKKAAELYEA